MKQSELEYQQHQKRLQENETEAKGEAQFDDAMEKMLSESTNHFEKYLFSSFKCSVLKIFERNLRILAFSFTKIHKILKILHITINKTTARKKIGIRFPLCINS